MKVPKTFILFCYWVMMLLTFHMLFSTLVYRVQESVIFMNVNVGGLKSYLFYVRKTMKVVSRPWNMRIGSHRGPEWAFWAFFGVFWAFSTVFALLWLSERTYMIYILFVCTFMYYRDRFNRIRSKNHYYLRVWGPCSEHDCPILPNLLRILQFFTLWNGRFFLDL